MAENGGVKHEYVAMMKHPGWISLDGSQPMKMMLPEGCTGMLFVFKTKKAAREYFGKKVELMPIQAVEKEKK